MPFLRKYGVAATLDGIVLVTKDAADFKSSPTLATGDVTISKDGGAFANLTTLPTVTPAAGTSVQVSLSATEATAARIAIRFIDQTSPKEWEDQEIIIETYGNASAQHAFDLATASTAQTGDSYAIVNHGTYGNSAIKILVDDLENRCTEARLAELDAANLPNDVDFVKKWINNKLIESPAGTWKLYDDDDTTVLKTWTWTSGTTTRSKAT